MQVRFRLIGDGPEMLNIKRLAEVFGINSISFEGWKDHNELSKLYKECDVLLLTSKTEGFGRVVPEAQSYGIPCVVTDNTGVRETVQHGETGFICEHNRFSISKAVIELLQKPSLYQTISKQSLDYSRNKYDKCRTAQAFCSVLNDNLNTEEYK